MGRGRNEVKNPVVQVCQYCKARFVRDKYREEKFCGFMCAEHFDLKMQKICRTFSEPEQLKILHENPMNYQFPNQNHSDNNVRDTLFLDKNMGVTLRGLVL
jgi:hypothetical protein